MAIATFGHQMVKICKPVFVRNTRLAVNGLVFFLCFFVACQSHKADVISLVWKNGNAVAISVPSYLIHDVDKFPLTVSLNGSDSEILGSFVKTDTGILFEPLIPLSPGMEYGVLQGNRVVGKLKVPVAQGSPPQVLAIYPQTDTVPENLLKFYISFSNPMQTGNALDNVFLLDKNSDTLERFFLNLQPELWDTTDKVLTLWIDPGRIKRNLVLNKELGNPLHQQQTYELLISGKWRDKKGLSSGKDYSKKFVVGPRGNEQPDINKWQLNIPKAGTVEPIIISVGYPLDHYLLEESISVYSGGRSVKGMVTATNKDKAAKFTPAGPWRGGKYVLRVNSRVEDLAGNNLNKIFDRDIYTQKKADNAYYERPFDIKP